LNDTNRNFSGACNQGAAAAKADYLLFLNNDVEIVEAGWLDELRSHFADRNVAGVGARLLWPNGVVQHAGVVVGTGFAAGHAFDHHLASDTGHADGLLIARECSALTAACLMVRRVDFDGVGGFDEEAFPVAFNDVDLCLKLRAKQRRLVWTPHATLLHKESQSRGKEDTPEKLRRAQREVQNLRSRWGPDLVADPYYHPSLNLSTHPFSGLAMPPRELSARRNRRNTG
jgi:GT2 family glycosyltransferase